MDSPIWEKIAPHLLAYESRFRRLADWDHHTPLWLLWCTFATVAMENSNIFLIAVVDNEIDAVAASEHHAQHFPNHEPWMHLAALTEELHALCLGYAHEAGIFWGPPYPDPPYDQVGALRAHLVDEAVNFYHPTSSL